MLTLSAKGKAITKFGDVETSKPQWIMASTRKFSDSPVGICPGLCFS